MAHNAQPGRVRDTGTPESTPHQLVLSHARSFQVCQTRVSSSVFALLKLGIKTPSHLSPRSPTAPTLGATC